MGSELVKPHHLGRRAVIYVRQSTPHQVLGNQESLRLQYALRQRARELGWREADIDVIDADLGLSGAAAAHRQGFKDLFARVPLGEVGLILSTEVTRLARNCSDWYPLLDVCGHRQCLIADRDGVYDAGSANGRADSSGRRNTSTEGFAMGTRRRCSDRSGRGVSRSPGRPGGARREDRRRFWTAIAAGRSSEDAAVEVGVSPAVGVRWFREAGGMPPSTLARSSRPPSGRYLSSAEREEVALWRAQGHGAREVARRLGRAASTVSRELRRNAATRGGGLEYRATTAQWHAERAARRPKPAKLATNSALRAYVRDRLAGAVAAPGGAAAAGPAVTWKGRRHGRRQHRRWASAWSPQQISRRLRLDFADDAAVRVSHEAVYQALYVQGRGALRRELTQCLRTGRG